MMPVAPCQERSHPARVPTRSHSVMRQNDNRFWESHGVISCAVQPDAMLLIGSGGATQISTDDYSEGAPELIVEVSASTAGYDLTTKYNAYQRNGVQEYMVWQVENAHTDRWDLRSGVYIPLPISEQGLIASRVFTGCSWLCPHSWRGISSRCWHTFGPRAEEW